MSTIYTTSGIIGPMGPRYYNDSTMMGFDGGGYFGPAHGSIAGMPYSVTWTANDCECTGGAPWTTQPNPIFDVSLTINYRTYDFGGGGTYGEFYLINGNLQQTAYNSGSFISTSIGFAITPGVQGEFQINNPTLVAQQGGIFLDQITAGVFLQAPAVPGPIVGAGLSGLALIGLALLFLFVHTFNVSTMINKGGYHERQADAQARKDKSGAKEHGPRQRQGGQD